MTSTTWSVDNFILLHFIVRYWDISECQNLVLQEV